MKADLVPEPAQRSRVVPLLNALNADLTQAQFGVLETMPWAKKRPKISKKMGRAYQDKDDRAAEKVTRTLLTELFPNGPLFIGNVALVAIFFRPTHQPIDGDNMFKHLADAGEGIFWANDRQCTGHAVLVECDPNHPCTVLGVAPHISSMRR